MEITLLIMENHGIVFLNFCGILNKLADVTADDIPSQLAAEEFEKCDGFFYYRKKVPQRGRRNRQRM